MRKMVTVFMATVLLVMPMTNAFAKEVNVTARDKAHSLASVLTENYGVSGLQYAIMDNGAITLSDTAGVYDKASGTKITKDMMFGIGSTSKMYVTAATMMLVDANKVDIDQPLTTYIKDFKMADERYKEITPRMLLNHSSGLYGTHYANSALFDDNSTDYHDGILDKLQSEQLKSKPGEYSVYCNDGFTLLEILVERVSGLSYSEFLEQYISTPLKLSNTKTPQDSFDRQRLVKNYFQGSDQVLPVENTNVLGTGGLYSTAEELVKFAEVLNGHRTDLLSKNAVTAMQSPEYKKGIWVSEKPNIFGYGLGWDAVNLTPFNDYGIVALNKGGDTDGYHSQMITLPEYNVSIAVVTSGGSSLFNIAFATNVLLEYLEDKHIIKEIQPDQTFKPAVKVKMPAEMSAYSGLYGSVGSTLNIEIKNGEIDFPVGLLTIPPQTYVYTGDGQFTSQDGSVSLSFEKQTNGKTYIELHGYMKLEGLGQVAITTYLYQKLDTNPLDGKTKRAWENRHGDNYFAVDEKINSGNLLYPLVENISVDVDHGYANGTKIVDTNKSVNVAEIPAGGRDAFDLNFYKVGETEYLMIHGESYISEDAIQPIYGGKSSSATIQSKGHGVWFKVNEKSANKKMTVDIPAGGGFIVYDVTGSLVNHSIVSKKNSIVLPADGFIYFGGKAGDVFKINME